MTLFDFKQYDDLNAQLDNEIYNIVGKTCMTYKKTVLILCGGGVKGIAHLGGLKALEELGILQNIKTVVGSSVGALLGLLFNIGYTPDELHDFIIMFDLKNLKCLDPSGFLSNYGFDTGEKITMVISKMIQNKNIDPTITFKQLFEKTGITLIINASCINDKQAYYFSHKTYPNMSVILATRMSTALPIYFAPVLFEGKMFLDAGCIDNYPIQLFKDTITSVIGFYLAETIEYVKEINNLEDFIINLVYCLFEGVTCNNLKGYEKYTVHIVLPSINVLQFDLDGLKKNDMYYRGYNAVIKYFNHNKEFIQNKKFMQNKNT